ncbi:hypothetical protein [Nonomuraea sp. NEAU-A123]|uniref:hypothetical protein n=1 Tax=Nonomuraea sp. NEAU-A123 TaxID=2839649 RepID=UPI001BE447B9|nr:hypothetical protein [Nonomuraea sp. NEAU-A123]MBT2233494.1 hypothetical protein [Nonomuraea sp. NEAU-A123]
MSDISVDLEAVAARLKQRMGDAVYEAAVLSVALDGVRAERDELAAENKRLRGVPEPGV